MSNIIVEKQIKGIGKHFSILKDSLINDWQNWFAMP